MQARTRQNCWAAALLAAIICIAFGDIVFLGRTLLTSNMQSGTMPAGPYGRGGGAYGYTGRRIESYPVIDYISAWQYEPYVKVLHDDIAHHWLPLWDPYVGSGAPLLANMAPAVLSPMRLIVAAVDKPAFWDFFLLLRLFVAAFFAYLFAREVGIGFTGSLVSAVAFALSGHFIYYINMPDLDVQIWLPVFLLATHRLEKKPTCRNFAVTAFLVALILLAGMPESALFIFLLAAFYLLFSLWKLDPQPWETRRWRKALIPFIAAGLAGFLVSLPLVLPFAEFLRNAFSPRFPGVGLRHVSAATAVSLILPNFFGHVHDIWIGIDSLHILPYVGCVTCLLAFAGICRKGSRPALTWFFVAFVVFYLLKAFGIPPIQWIGQLPLFSMTLFPKHAFPEFAFCLAMLAGMGADCVLRNEVNYSRFGLAALGVALTGFGFAVCYWKKAAYFGGLQDLTESCLLFAVAFGFTWLLGMTARRTAPSSAIAIALVLLPAAELIAFIPRQRTERYEAFTKPPFVDFLRANSQPYRTFSVDQVLVPNTNSAYRIDDIRSMDPLQVSRYRDFLQAEFSPDIYDRFDGLEVSRGIIRSPLLDLMNVKYVLASPRLPARGLEADRFELVYDREVRIYRNKHALPRAFVVGHAEVIPDKNRILARLADPQFDPRQGVILEENVANNSATDSPVVSPAVFERYEPNYVRLHADLARPGWLVLTDTYYPGWKVLVDGKSERILPADYIYRAVWVSSGSHVVEFVYRPASFVWGVMISLSTIAILLLVPLLARLGASGLKGREGRLARVSGEREAESVSA